MHDTHRGPAIRRAGLSDMPVLKTCFEMASDGLAQHFWEQSRAPGETVDDVSARRIREKLENPGNSIWVAGEGFGSVVSYHIGDTPAPLDDLPPIIRPLVTLENQALGTHYINMLAVLPAFRRQGVARALVAAARGGAEGRRLSLIVSDANETARALYEAEGFRDVAASPMVSDGWQAPGRDWILMVTRD